jgi:hypothetical protein
LNNEIVIEEREKKKPLKKGLLQFGFYGAGVTVLG